MTDSQFLTAPTSPYAEIVLETIPVDGTGNPSSAVLGSLSDPVNYAHVLDIRGAQDAE